MQLVLAPLARARAHAHLDRQVHALPHLWEGLQAPPRLYHQRLRAQVRVRARVWLLRRLLDHIASDSLPQYAKLLPPC